MNEETLRKFDLLGRGIASLRGETKTVPEGALMAFKSHIEDKNATVTVYPDRIEWHRNRVLSGRADTNTIMMRSVTGVRTRKSRLTYTDVEVQSGASSVTMRVTKDQATALRQAVAEFTRR